MQLHRLGFPPQLEVEQLHENRERHREIGVALRDVEAETFPDQVHPDEEEETQG